MKSISAIIFLLFIATASHAQDAVMPDGHVDAIYNSSTGTITYQRTGELTKDGVVLIDLKLTALGKLAETDPHSDALMNTIQKEKESLNLLQNRIIVQRERLMKPLPPMEEVH